MPAVKKGKYILRYKNILLIILVIWMFSFAYQRNNVPLLSEDPGRVRKGVREQSWGEDICGSPLPHHYETVQGCIIKWRHRPGDSVSPLSLPS